MFRLNNFREEALWTEVYVAAVRRGCGTIAAKDLADQAVDAYRERQ